jgi:hypothetical protein
MFMMMDWFFSSYYQGEVIMLEGQNVARRSQRLDASMEDASDLPRHFSLSGHCWQSTTRPPSPPELPARVARPARSSIKSRKHIPRLKNNTV